VIDMAAIDADVIPAEVAGEIAGVTLIDGEPAELVDAHWLFARANGAGGRSGPADRPLCRLPDDDPWMQNMLRPIVEAAGYRVVGGVETPADLVIATAEGATPPKAVQGSRVILLRSAPTPTRDGSIYRYDRAGLIDALKVASGGQS
jgi:two-component system chemotaxis sensor kinase CheA